VQTALREHKDLVAQLVPKVRKVLLESKALMAHMVRKAFMGAWALKV
jgi:hypothetical protein